jgi:peptidoglycan hydrolase-like protein with peptidoglycan-binding domain
VRFRKEKPEINLAARLAAYPVYDGNKAPETVERALNKGTEGADVYWLQMKLKELGFYKGTVTGQYQDGTASAVKQYQRSRGISQSGKADTKTLTALYTEVNQPKTTVKPKE